MLLLSMALASCSPADDSPTGAIRLFLRAVRQRDTKQVYQRLAPSTQKRFQKLASQATAQTGGHRKFKPHELLAQLEKPRYVQSKVELVETKGNRAKVKLISHRDKRYEIIELRRIDGHWRIVLPRVTPTSQPFAGSIKDSK